MQYATFMPARLTSALDNDRKLSLRVAFVYAPERFWNISQLIAPLDDRLHATRLDEPAEDLEIVLCQLGDEERDDPAAASDRGQAHLEEVGQRRAGTAFAMLHSGRAHADVRRAFTQHSSTLRPRAVACDV